MWSHCNMPPGGRQDSAAVVCGHVWADGMRIEGSISAFAHDVGRLV